MPKPKSRDQAVELLAQYFSLGERELNVAEGFSLLTERAKRHVEILINDHIANEIPQLRQIYDNISHQDQQRFNRVIERIQDVKRGIPPDEDLDSAL